MSVIYSAGAKPPNDFSEITKHLAQYLEGNVLTFFLTGQDLNRHIVNSLYEKQAEFVNIKTLNIVLNCNGGSIDAAYQIVQFLRTRCEQIKIYVPRWAKSAATFMCLGADEIIMTEIGELGPMDAQIPDPRNPLKTMSALDGFKAMEALRDFAMESFDLMNLNLINKVSDMPLKDMMAETENFVGGMISPIFGKFEPLDLGGYSQALRLGREYLKRIISKTNHGKSFPGGQQALIDQIIWMYPSHSFVIDYEEARNLKLDVRLCDETEANILGRVLPYCTGQLDYIDFVNFADTRQKEEKSKANEHQEK